MHSRYSKYYKLPIVEMENAHTIRDNLKQPNEEINICS